MFLILILNNVKQKLNKIKFAFKILCLSIKYLKVCMRKAGLLILIFFVIFIIGYLFSRPAFNYLSGFLSKSEQVNANILIVEGWLPEYALEMAVKEFQKGTYDYVIVTSIKSENEYFELSENGYLIFYPKLKNLLNDQNSIHRIDVRAYGSLNDTHAAHFNLFVNDSLVSDFVADKRKKDFIINWKGSISRIDSIMVEFTNDKVDDYGDINLFVKDIVIDNKFILPYLNNSEYDMGQIDGKRRFINNTNSVAELARNKLISLGVDPGKVIAVPGAKVKINRTLTSALAFRDWLKTSDIKVKGITIISLGTHARRTWMTYNRIMNEKFNIGVMSIPDKINDHSKESKFLKTFRETLGILYYWIILIPY
jgi:hypothetical protein